MKFVVSPGEPGLQSARSESYTETAAQSPAKPHDLAQFEFSPSRPLRSIFLGGAAIVAACTGEYQALGDSTILAWDNRPDSWGKWGYTNGPAGQNNIELRLWAGRTENHFDRYLVIPSSLMSSVRVLGLAAGTRTYFTMTAYVKSEQLQSSTSNIAQFDASAGPPTPIRRDADVIIQYDAMTPASLSIIPPGGSVTNQPPAGGVTNHPTTLTMIILPDGTPEVSISGTPGKTVTIQRSHDLSSWQSVANATLPTGTNAPPGFTQVFVFEDRDPAANRHHGESMFYRTVSSE